MKKIEKHKNVKGKWSESPFNGSELPSDIKYDATNLINSSNKWTKAYCWSRLKLENSSWKLFIKFLRTT